MDDSKTPPQTSPDLGGLNIPPVAGANTGDNPAGAHLSASEAHVQQRKRGRPPGSKNASKGNTGPSVLPLSQTQFAQLYSPELWGKILSAPADAMAGITGRSHWQISEKEREMLGGTGSIAAQCFAVSDPRWLAVSLALVAVIDVYGLRLVMDLQIRKKEQAEAAARKKQEQR